MASAFKTPHTSLPRHPFGGVRLKQRRPLFFPPAQPSAIFDSEGLAVAIAAALLGVFVLHYFVL